MNRRQIFVAIVVICAGVVSGTIYGTHRGAAPGASVDMLLAGIATCMTQSDGVSCTRPYIQQLLALQDGVATMDSIESKFSPAQCHYIGHVVGQQMYARYHDVETALSSCNRTCDSACVHGIVGEAFAEELGFKNPDEDTDLDLEHLSTEELRTIGTRLCNSLGACHGVGHTLFQVFKKFEPAFALCREIATSSIQQCYNGVTMEYADILSSRNMRVVSGVTYPNPETLDTLCMLPILAEKRACFRYFPRMVAETLKQQNVSQDESLRRVQDLCESYTKTDDRTACFAGIGSFLSYEVLKDPVTAVQSCERFGTPLDRAACTIGRIYIATEDRKEPLAAYCAAMSDSSQKAACYQDLFYFLRANLSADDAKKLCGTNNDLCDQGFQKNALDSWQEIKKTFAR